MRFAAIHSLTDPPSPRAGQTVRPGPRPLRSTTFGRVRAWFQRRAVLAELRGLDHRTLADLCIYPGDFQAIADGTYIREGGAHDVALKPATGSSNLPRQGRPYY